MTNLCCALNCNEPAIIADRCARHYGEHRAAKRAAKHALAVPPVTPPVAPPAGVQRNNVLAADPVGRPVYEPKPGLMQLAERLEAALVGTVCMSDDDKLAHLRAIARQSGARPDRPWPEAGETIRIEKREPSFTAGALAWHAPGAEQRGWE